MTIPLIVLAVLATIGGALNLPGLHTLTTWLEHTLGGGEHAAAAAEGAVAEAGAAAEAAGGFNLTVAVSATVLALVAIAIAYFLYYRRYQEQQTIPAAKRPDDPLRAYLGPLFTVFENKYWIDELYWAVFLNPYIALARFLADVVDWRFWHDWFHDTVIVGGFNLLTRVLSVRIDLGIIDAIANGLGRLAQGTGAGLRRLQTGFVRNYALAVFVGVVVIVGFVILR
jgi:NADH-quinone oxidoreductase subunit L